jgi:hypothetical protein
MMKWELATLTHKDILPMADLPSLRQRQAIWRFELSLVADREQAEVGVLLSPLASADSAVACQENLHQGWYRELFLLFCAQLTSYAGMAYE